MSGKKARAARQAARAAGPRAGRGATLASWRSWKSGFAALTVVAVLAGSFVLPDAFDDAGTPTAAQGHDSTSGPRVGDGLEPGTPVPAFAERDVETGRGITAASLRRQRTLLFFSEGIMCQACFEQIRDLEAMGAELDERGIALVSITPDAPGELRQAIRQYGIRTPMIADEDRDMSAAFDTLGRGMHEDTPGHAFALIEGGRIRWYRDYWLPPDSTMYVEPARVLADLASP